MPDNNFDILTTKTKTKGAKIEGLKDLYRTGLEAKRRKMKVALKVLAYLQGEQWIDIDDFGNGHFQRVPTRVKNVHHKVSDNQLIIYARQAASNFATGLSTYSARPLTNDPDDKAAASLATRFLAMRDIQDDEDWLRYNEIMEIMINGEVMRETYYSPRKTTEDGISGDLVTETIPLSHYVKCPYVGQQWPPPWIIISDQRHVDWIKAEFGVKVEPETLDPMGRLFDDMMGGLASSGSGPVLRQVEHMKNTALLHRCVCAPSEKYPEGKVFIWSGDTLIDERDFQIPGMYPLSIGTFFPMPTATYSMGYFDSLVANQTELNVILSQMAEYRERNLRMDIITDGRGKVGEAVLDDETGQRMLILPVGSTKWEVMQYSMDWRAVDQELLRCRQGMRDKSGSPEPVLGQQMPGDTSATEIQIMKDAGMQKVALHMWLMDRYFCDVQKKKLILAKEYFKAARLLEESGNSGNSEVTFFFGAEFRRTKDVQAVPSPKLTPAQRRQALSEASMQKLFGPFLDPQNIPDPFFEFAARKALRFKGLTEEEEQFNDWTMPFEDLKAFVGELQTMGYKSKSLQAMMGLAQLEQTAQMFDLGIDPATASQMLTMDAQRVADQLEQGIDPTQLEGGLQDELIIADEQKAAIEGTAGAREDYKSEAGSSKAATEGAAYVPMADNVTAAEQLLPAVRE